MKLPYAELQAAGLPILGQAVDDLIATFPTDSEGIPWLDLTKQATLVEPVRIWGEVRRTDLMPGTWLFFTYDYKFSHVVKYPAMPLISKPAAIGEINFSTYPREPRAKVRYDILQKRQIARLWQSFGVPVFVDLCIENEFLDLALLGVPDGWHSYCVRGYNRYAEEIVETYELAKQKAGTEDILFVLYGGGKVMRGLAEDYDWTFVPERMRRVDKAVGELRRVHGVGTGLASIPPKG